MRHKSPCDWRSPTLLLQGMGKVVLWEIAEEGGARSGAETRESDYRSEEAPRG